MKKQNNSICAHASKYRSQCLCKLVVFTRTWHIQYCSSSIILDLFICHTCIEHTRKITGSYGNWPMWDNSPLMTLLAVQRMVHVLRWYFTCVWVKIVRNVFRPVNIIIIIIIIVLRNNCFVKLCELAVCMWWVTIVQYDHAVGLLYIGLFLTPTRVAGVKRSSASVCVYICAYTSVCACVCVSPLSVCPHDKTKTAETTVTEFTTEIVHHESRLLV